MKTKLINILKLSFLLLAAYLIYSNLYKLNLVWLSFSGTTKEIIISATLYSLLTIFFSILGCNYQLKKNSLKSSVESKLGQLEEVIELARAMISEFEEKIIFKCKYTDSRASEKLAPAKWILSSLERKLNYANVAKHIISTSKLNRILSEELDLHSSPTNIVLASERCSVLPKKLNLMDCTFILKDIFNEVKSDLDFVSKVPLEEKHYKFPSRGQTLRLV